MSGDEWCLSCYKTSGLSKEILAFKINVSFLKSLVFFFVFVTFLLFRSFKRFLEHAVKFSTSRATLRWLSISTQRWECWVVGLVKPSNTEPLCGEVWVVSLGFSRSFVLCFKWDPTWDRMTCVRVYFKVESSFC